MRVALVTDYWLPTLGGVQTAVKALRGMLQVAGHEAIVFAPRGARDEAVDEAVAVPVSPVFRPDGYPFAWSPGAVERTLEREFRARRIDVVHTHSEMFTALGAIRAARALRLPTVHTMHGRIDVYTRHVLPLPALTMPLLARMHASRIPHRGVQVPGGTPATSTRAARAMWRVLLAQAAAVDAVVVPSEHFRRKLAAQGVTTPMTVVPNGVEPAVREWIAAPTPRDRASGRPLRLAWVGRLSPEKRPLVFVEAIAALGDAVRADMLGDGVAGGAVRRAAAAASATLRLHGAVPQRRVVEIVAAADLVVSTSLDFDVQPMALLEAIAAGTPVLVSDPDLAEVVPDGAAITTPTPDAAGVVGAVRALAADPARLDRARAAVAHASSASTPLVDQMIAVYDRVLAQHQ